MDIDADDVKSDDKRCIRCNKNMRKIPKAHQKVIDTEALADEVTTWLRDNYSVGDLVYREARIDSVLCKNCHSQLRLHQSNKRFKLEEQKVDENPTEHESSSSTQTSTSDTTIESSQSSLNDPSVKFLAKPEIEEVIELPLKRTVSTHSYCCLCRSNDKLVVVPYPARLQVYSRLQIVIPKGKFLNINNFIQSLNVNVILYLIGNRCCSKHFINKRFYEDDLKLVRVHSLYTSIEVSDLTELLKNLSVRVDRDLFDRVSDYTIDEKRLFVFTGLNWEQLIELREMLSSMRNSDSRDITQALVVFLLKLRSGNSNKMIASILGIEYSQRISDYVDSVIRSFKADILPIYFGLHAVPRETLIRDHTTAIAKKLHNLNDDQLLLIADGTYLRHQKSSNNEYQRKSYSGQKKCHLAKPFTICMPDGYIVDVLGPFHGIVNDAQILKHLLQMDNEFNDLIQANDVFVLDRGFRDVVSSLKEKGFKVLMPSLKGQRNQLTAEESNHSRKVTIVRWAVEAVHGVIGQKNKLLHNQLDNKLLPNAQVLCKIACFMNNTFGKRFHSHVDISEEIVERIQQSPEKNTLAEEVEAERWGRRKTKFKNITSTDLEDFPEMTERDLKIFFTGSYQLKQAVSYLAETLDSNGMQ